MRIISKYKDYYDGVQAYGFDEKLIYERSTDIIKTDELVGYSVFESKLWESYPACDSILLNQDHTEDLNLRLKIEYFPIGFCGKFYPCTSFVKYSEKVEISRTTFYNSKSVLAFIKKLKLKYSKIRFKEEYYYGTEPTIKELDNYFMNPIFNKKYSNWFQQIGAPIFIFTVNPNLKHYIDSESNLIFVIKNPKLSKYEFYKRWDSYLAFQELSLFLGGVLTLREQIPTNSTDKEKIKQHGFDLKYGFRKRPK